MALEIYTINGKSKLLLGSLNYDNASIQDALNYVQQQTGLQIDVYGRTVLHENHRLPLLQGLQKSKMPVSADTLESLADFKFDSDNNLVLIGD
ncbi:hypothetical protein [Hymenobacter sp. BT730]|uniref:hypothetical protein n=1 Tax=Hymenobacter sp. BT730 TaxID=3063332 RepID=UPI0026DF125C|nr:hypothetical protein [Hymenobacter sp. BT730]